MPHHIIVHIKADLISNNNKKKIGQNKNTILKVVNVLYKCRHGCGVCRYAGCDLGGHSARRTAVVTRVRTLA